jgi:dsRNA-specific ribonuclease
MRQRWFQRKWCALLRFRAALVGEASLDDAAQRAKSAASFKGCMRTLGARPMDHFDLHRALRPNASSRKADGPSEVTARRISSSVARAIIGAHPLQQGAGSVRQTHL